MGAKQPSEDSVVDLGRGKRVRRAVNYSEHLSDKHLYITTGDEAWKFVTGGSGTDDSEAEDGEDGGNLAQVQNALKRQPKKAKERLPCKYCGKTFLMLNRHQKTCKRLGQRRCSRCKKWIENDKFEYHCTKCKPIERKKAPRQTPRQASPMHNLAVCEHCGCKLNTRTIQTHMEKCPALMAANLGSTKLDTRPYMQTVNNLLVQMHKWDLLRFLTTHGGPLMPGVGKISFRFPEENGTQSHFASIGKNGTILTENGSNVYKTLGAYIIAEGESRRSGNVECVCYEGLPLLQLLTSYYAIGPLANYMHPHGPLRAGKGVLTFANGECPADLLPDGRIKFRVPHRANAISCWSLDMYNLLSRGTENVDKSYVMYKNEKSALCSARVQAQSLPKTFEGLCSPTCG